MTKKHGLGRGLNALITDRQAVDDPGPAGGTMIPLNRIAASPFQPRIEFQEEGMEDLIRSVKEQGVVQPILVRSRGDGYELIAGERRCRAARAAGLSAVPAIIREATDREALELALIENLLRDGLNVMEEATGYRRLMDQFSMTQEQVADRLGKARASVANTIRLLDLPDEIKDYVRQSKLSAGHAKVLLGIEIPEERVLIARQAIKEALSVRDLEVLVAKRRRTRRTRRAARDDIAPVHLARVSDVLRRHLGTSVRITACRTLANGKKMKGLIEVDFFNADDLTRILEVLGVSEKNGQ